MGDFVMKKNSSICTLLETVMIFVLVFLWLNPVCAAITPEDNYDTEALGDPSPEVFAWNGSIGYYDNQLIYCGDDKKIYAYDLDTGASTLVSDTSGIGDPWESTAGFLVSSDDYLYFHDNDFPTVNIYRLDLTAPRPTNYTSFNTGCSGSIYSFTENPWTNVIWFASAEFGGNMYLYEVDGAFTAATQRAAFAPPNGGGSGPIIFKGQQTLLYGESVWGGDGYFHEVDTATGTVTTQDYLTFDGGLAGACYGYESIYATSGSGNTIYYIDGNTKTEVGATLEDAQGIVFGDGEVYISEQKSSDGSGTISLHALWKRNGEEPPSDDSSNCFISASGTESDISEKDISAAILVLFLCASLFPAVRFFRRER